MNKKINLILSSVLCLILMTNCSSWSNASNGALIGSIGGTILGAGIGAAVDGDWGANVGSNLGMTIGTIAGASIGAQMDEDNAKKQIQQNNSPAQTEDDNVFVDESTGKKYRRITQQNDIVFESRSTNLDQESARALQDIASYLVQNNQEIYIYGSTDDIESRDQSMQLSQDRARAVAGYLSALGVNVVRMHIRGLGSTSPIADNSTMDGRAMNRCVEIYVAE